MCLSRAAVEQCVEDAKQIDDTRARLRACQRDLDETGGRVQQCERQANAERRAVELERVAHAEQVRVMRLELDRRITPARLVVWVGVALAAGYVAGRIHQYDRGTR